MSTKIYDAYRVKKDVNLRDLLTRMRKIAEDTMASDEDTLRMIHAYSVAVASDIVKYNRRDFRRAVEIISNNKDNKFTYDLIRWIERCLKEADEDMNQNLLSISLKSSIWFDDDYWYIKFFVNWGTPTAMVRNIEAGCNELEDFHYQNQCDVPEHIPEEEYHARSVKWDELLSKDDDFTDMFEFTIFDPSRFVKLVTRYYWRGEQDVHKHLAYKFDKPVDIKDDETDPVIETKTDL